ncbi:MAG: diacylglycerol kinase family protein [Candidatus Omnitrophota bacterium]|jgi:YegS/Rv2252/BmrU family lipid kinase
MGKKIKKINVIINPASGKGESTLPIINAAMKEAGITWEASITHQAGDAARFAKTAVKEGIDALAVYGGDGTLVEAISGLIGSEIPVAVFPGGSANVMATELGIPANLKEACALLSQDPIETKTIDVGQFDKRYFIAGISLGFESDVVKGADRETKNKIGIFAYLLSAAAALKKTKKAVYHLKIDGHEHEVQGLTCIIANTGNLGFSDISFDKHIDVSDGLLDVVVVRKANLSLFKLMVITLFKRERPDNLELVEHWQGKNISVSSSPKQTVQCDGEILEKMPLHIKVIPGAIKVLVPKKNGSTIE